MDDPETWSDDTRETLATAAVLSKRWRGPLRTATVSRPQVDVDRCDAIQATTAEGRILLALGLPGGTEEVCVRLANVQGNFQLTGEWTGETRTITVGNEGIRLPVVPTGDGLLVSLAHT